MAATNRSIANRQPLEDYGLVYENLIGKYLPAPFWLLADLF